MNKRKSVFLPHLLTLFSIALPLSHASAVETKAQLHVPWTLLETRLQSSLNTNTQGLQTKVADMPLDAGGVRWNVTGLVFDTKYKAASTTLTQESIVFRTPETAVHITIGQISVNQVVERMVNGTLIRVHLQASCGPIQMVQEHAHVEAGFSLDWTSGSPVSRLGRLDLSWAANSWQIPDFPCAGPAGLPEILKEQILERVKDAAEFKPLLAEYLSSESQKQVQEGLKRLREPFQVETGTSKLAMKAGHLVPTSSGVIVDISIGEPNPRRAKDPRPRPTDHLLSTLPKDRPALLGGKDVIELAIATELATGPNFFRFDAQKNKGFRELMRSRFVQFFIWRDLWNFSKSAPFFINVFKPKEVALTVGKNGSLSSTLNLLGVVQGYRDHKWWPYVNIDGPVKANVDLKITNGILSYQTTIIDQTLAADYTVDYKARYGRGSSIPVERIGGALLGKQKDLSGEINWPDTDFGTAGRYRAHGFRWVDSDNFVLNWAPVVTPN